MVDSNDTYVKVTEDGVLQFLGKSPLAPLEDTSAVELGSPLSFNGGGGGGFEPTEQQLAAMNSGITATKVATYDTLPDDEDVKDIIEDHFVAGTNITITSNQDGTQTIASTASSGVPTITSDDNGKFLRANYYNATSTSDCSWENLSGTAIVDALSTAQQDAINSGITSTKVTQYDNRVSHVLDASYNIPAGFTDRIYYGGMVNHIPDESYGLITYTNSVQSFGQRLAAAIGASHKLYFRFKPSGSSAVWTDWIKLDIDALSNYTPAPTTYTTPTTGANVTDVSGGYVVSNNICTVNICCNYSSPTTGDVLFSNLPKPALQPGSTDDTISTVLLLGSTSNASTGKTGAHVYLTQGGNIIASDESYSSLGSNSKIITGSYLIDTST